jgi:hypothetical protein
MTCPGPTEPSEGGAVTIPVHAKEAGLLADAEWKRARALLPTQEPGQGRPRRDDRQVLCGILWIVTTPLPKGSGFSANACVNYRYVSCRRLRPSPKESLSSLRLTGALALKLDGRTQSNVVALAAKILRADRLLDTTSRIFGCQGRKRPQTSLQSILREGGAPGFRCQQKQTVPAS